MLILKVFVFILGLVIVAATIVSAIRTFVLPRSVPDPLTNFVLRTVRFFFNLRLRSADNYADRDRVMAFYAPFSMVSLLPTWLIIVSIGYTAMYGFYGFALIIIINWGCHHFP